MATIKNTMLVSPDDVKGATYTNYNVDDALVGPTIREAQEIHLQSIIGSNLFYRLQALVFNQIMGNTDAIDDEENAEYKTLLDEYIQPYLVNKAQALLCVPASFKLRNLGVTKTSDDNIQQVTLKEVMAVQRRFNEMAAKYATYLSKYLCAHKEDFEELGQSECGCGLFVPPVLGKTFVHNGLVLGSTKNGCKC